VADAPAETRVSVAVPLKKRASSWVAVPWAPTVLEKMSVLAGVEMFVGAALDVLMRTETIPGSTRPASKTWTQYVPAASDCWIWAASAGVTTLPATGTHVVAPASVPTTRFIVGSSTLPVTFEITLTSVTPTVVVAERLKVEMVDPPSGTSAVENCEWVGTAVVGAVYRELQPAAVKAKATALAAAARRTTKREILGTKFQFSNNASTRCLTPMNTVRLGCPGRTALVILLALSSLGLGQGATFRLAANDVAIYATVLDRDHHLVTDLTRDDFEVRDNGRPVALSVFSADPAPITLGLMLDTSGSMESNLPLVITGAEELIDRLGPEDRVRIGAFGSRTITSPEFTTSHPSLLQFLRTRVHAGGETPLWNAVDLMMVYLKDVPGRRVVLVFTDGYDTTTLQHGFDAVRARADQEEVMLYAIGCWIGPGSGDDRPDGNLRKIADHTGGGYVELTWSQGSDLGPTFARVADELHHQYVLGFVPTTLDGKTHDLEVRVKGSGLTVRARKTYTSGSGPAGREPGLTP
jgi:Ca-activated chloride channel family protein